MSYTEREEKPTLGAKRLMLMLFTWAHLYPVSGAIAAAATGYTLLYH